MSTTDEFVLEVSEEKEYPILREDTILEVKVVECKKETSNFVDKDTGEKVEQVKFVFLSQDSEAVDAEGNTVDIEDRKFWGYTSTKFTTHENCRLRAWVQEIMAVDELPPGFRFKPSDLEGLRCRIVLGENYWESKKKFNADGTPKTEGNNKVKDVIRSRTASHVEEPF